MKTPIKDYLSEIVESVRPDESGEVADYIPTLAEANPDRLALAMTTVSGRTYTAGDTDTEFTIQSMSKPFAYAAEADGFKKFLIVLTRPKGFRRTAPKRPQLLRQIFRSNPVVAELLITRHERYNASLDWAAELERKGQAYIFYANNMSITKAERKRSKLIHNYELGRAQADAEWPAIREFMGL